MGWSNSWLMAASSAFLRLHPLPFFVGHMPSQGGKLPGALQVLTGIHGYDFPIDVTRTVAHEKGGQVGELFGSAKAPERNPLLGGLFEVRARQQTGKRTFGRDRARRDAVH